MLEKNRYFFGLFWACAKIFTISHKFQQLSRICVKYTYRQARRAY